MRNMQLERLKKFVTGAWVLASVVLGVFVRDMTWQMWTAFVALSVLPPLALLRWWNDPAQTTSEAIHDARRKTWPS